MIDVGHGRGGGARIPGDASLRAAQNSDPVHQLLDDRARWGLEPPSKLLAPTSRGRCSRGIRLTAHAVCVRVNLIN